MKYSGYMLVLLAATAQAEVYKSINANGEVVYSDIPSQGAERVEMPALPTYTPVPLPATPPAPVARAQAAEEAYSAFSMARPHADETIRGTAGRVDVSLTLEPALQVEAGHGIQYFLDGTPQGKPVAQLSTSLMNVDRGTHTVSAAVLDDSGKVIIKTTPVTIYIHR